VLKSEVLVIDDDPAIRELLLQILSGEGFKTLTAESAEEALEFLKEHSPDFIFSDIIMPGKSGLDMLRELNEANSDIPIIIMTGTGNMRTAIEAAQFDAFDYIEKPFDIEQIISAAKIAYKVRNIRKEIVSTEFDIVPSSDSEEIIGKSQAIQTVFKQVGKILKTSQSTPVIIEGETGTGKNLVAKVIHTSSFNHNEPIITVDCSAIEKEYLEIELFGSEDDEGDGRNKIQDGKIGQAGNGTLILNEISEIPKLVQAKLLKVVKNRKYQRINSSEAFDIKARIIVTTKKDLKKLIKDGLFRADLYYRLSVYAIQIPPLRNRKEDITLLSQFFLKDASSNMHKSVNSITNSFIDRLNEYDFPGNVRELKNIINQAVMNARANQLMPEDLPDLDGQMKTNGDHSFDGDSSQGKKAQERQLSAIMFTDIKGFSKMMGEDEQKALTLLEEHDQLIYKEIAEYNGSLIKHIGDAVMATFTSSVYAVQCAVAIQKVLAERNSHLEKEEMLLLKIGIHIGDVVIKENDAFGDGVNIASRVEEFSEPGGICISQDVYNQVRNQLHISTEDIGSQKLKNINSEVRIYRVNVN